MDAEGLKVLGAGLAIGLGSLVLVSGLVFLVQRR